MREFLFLPMMILAAAIILPVAIIFLALIGIVMWVGEKQGFIKAGGIHRDSEDIGIW